MSCFFAVESLFLLLRSCRDKLLFCFMRKRKCLGAKLGQEHGVKENEGKRAHSR